MLKKNDGVVPRTKRKCVTTFAIDSFSTLSRRFFRRMLYTECVRILAHRGVKFFIFQFSLDFLCGLVNFVKNSTSQSGNTPKQTMMIKRLLMIGNCNEMKNRKMENGTSGGENYFVYFVASQERRRPNFAQKLTSEIFTRQFWAV